MYSYDAQDTDELSFAEGDIIEIVHEGKWRNYFLCLRPVASRHENGMLRQPVVLLESRLVNRWLKFTAARPYPFTHSVQYFAFSALMLLVGQLEGHPACKNIRVVGCWRGYLSGAQCRLAYSPVDSTATDRLLLQ